MRQQVVTGFHWNATVSSTEITVLVGRARVPLASNLLPQVIPLAVPLSVILKIRTAASLGGVPVRLVVIDVMA